MSLSGRASRPMLQALSPGMFLTPFWCPVTSSCSCLGVTIPLLKPRGVKSRMERGLVAIRVVRDYGMFDRREAPQYYPDITRSNTERP